MTLYFCPCGTKQAAFDILSTEELRCRFCGQVFSMEELRVFNTPRKESADESRTEINEDD